MIHCVMIVKTSSDETDYKLRGRALRPALWPFPARGCAVDRSRSAPRRREVRDEKRCARKDAPAAGPLLPGGAWLRNRSLSGGPWAEAPFLATPAHLHLDKNRARLAEKPRRNAVRLTLRASDGVGEV